MKRKVVCLLCGVLSIAFVGCGSSNAEPSDESWGKITPQIVESESQSDKAGASGQEAAETASSPVNEADNTSVSTELSNDSSETGTEGNEAAGAAEFEFPAIAGNYYLDGKKENGALEIYRDGVFRVFDSEGMLINNGYVEHVAEEIGDTTIWWYYLYIDPDNLYLSFVDNGSEKIEEFTTGNGDGDHYVLDQGDASGKEAYIGTWVEPIAGRGYMTIEGMNDGSCKVEVNWGSSAFESARWDFVANYDAGTGDFVYEAGTYQFIEFAEDGTDTVKESKEVKGKLHYENGRLYWTDSAYENGEPYEFFKSGVE